jgi:hypothetical protein
MKEINFSGEKPNWLEKVLRFTILGGIIYLLAKLVNYTAPTLIEAIKNGWILAGLVFLSTLGFLLVKSLWSKFWIWYAGICKRISRAFIKYDPLAFMDGYIEIVTEKRRKLQEHKQVLHTVKSEIDQDSAALRESIEVRLKTAAAAKQLGDIAQAEHLSGLAAEDKQALEMYKPNLARVTESLAFMNELDSNWGRSIERQRNMVQNLRRQYRTLYASAKALGHAEDFIRGNTDAGRVFQESIIALRERSAEKIAYIEAFMRDSKDIMGRMAIEKKMISSDGMNLLDTYIQDKNKLFLNDVDTPVAQPNSEKQATTEFRY